MKTYFFSIYSLFLCAALVPLLCAAQGLLNTNGTSLVSNGAVNIVIQDGGFTNAGTFTKSTSSFVFTGNTSTANSFIAGTAATDFYNLTLNKSANGLQLNRNIGVSNVVTFTSGDSIFLNNNNVDLGSTGSISGENSTRRFTGKTGGYIMITQSLNAPSAVNPGNIGIDITSAANLGSTVIKRSHTIFRNKSIKRSFEITPSNNSALNASVNFYYFTSELNGVSEATLATFSSANSGTNWNYATNIIPNTSLHYVTTNNIASLSLFTLFNTNVDLPVRLLYLSGKTTNSKVILDWATASELENDHFDIERSANGTTFSKIGVAKGSGNSSTQQLYQFTDEDPFAGSNYYRLKQVDLNHAFVYSGVVSVLVKEPVVSLTLSPNPASNLLHLKITDAVSEQIEMNLIGQNGKLCRKTYMNCKKGETNFMITIEDLPKGIYYINISGRNKQFVKFLKM